MTREWNHGLLGCFDNIGLCLITYLAPCYTAGKNAEAVGEDCLVCGVLTLVPLVGAWFRAQIRGKIREQKGIEGSLVTDLLLHLCCPCCALAQEGQEVGTDIPTVSMVRE
ncbi:PREDICTED: cell number regulator 3-like [Branchiostoma belcheri]|uniref:Cell number regulator 3-like n=1 Tax=Branchiostoma belcheri TaxID=7741 RepID=A0A6P4ZNW2_BRABE|nr:PREDICTED: cell number regulator 3-like [Branchiostoma belcheri]KAI8486440.1 hypothetical protein Bbelb_359390 [Branchiostoma belcheri]